MNILKPPRLEKRSRHLGKLCCKSYCAVFCPFFKERKTDKLLIPCDLKIMQRTFALNLNRHYMLKGELDQAMIKLRSFIHPLQTLS